MLLLCCCCRRRRLLLLLSSPSVVVVVVVVVLVGFRGDGGSHLRRSVHKINYFAINVHAACDAQISGDSEGECSREQGPASECATQERAHGVGWRARWCSGGGVWQWVRGGGVAVVVSGSGCGVVVWRWWCLAVGEGWWCGGGVWQWVRGGGVAVVSGSGRGGWGCKNQTENHESGAMLGVALFELPLSFPLPACLSSSPVVVLDVLWLCCYGCAWRLLRAHA